MVMLTTNAFYSTKPRMPGRLILSVAALFGLLIAGCGFSVAEPDSLPTHPPLDPTYEAMIREQRSPEVPDLPFPDNPDPSACGIPVVWGTEETAWLNGRYDGALIQPVVLLYDSHLRLGVSARAPHGTPVEVLLYQQNPLTDYYLVKIIDMEAPNEGWIPAPLLSFEPVTP